MNELRKEIRKLLDETECSRPAVLRRSRKEDYLYTTDLPQAASADAVTGFRRRAENAGWKTSAERGWVELDRIPETLPAGIIPDRTGTEARCCALILRMHPESRRNGDREKRILLKAAEENAEAYEEVCGALHREWAALLRRSEPLPDLPADYFGEGRNT